MKGLATAINATFIARAQPDDQHLCSWSGSFGLGSASVDQAVCEPKRAGPRNCPRRPAGFSRQNDWDAEGKSEIQARATRVDGPRGSYE